MSDCVVSTWWDRLGWDLTEVILCKLPVRSMVRASAVCKQWRDVLQQQQKQARRPWLFLHGHNNVVPSLGRSGFAYDPRDGDSWVSFPLPPDCFAGAGGLAFSSPSPSRLSVAPLLRSSCSTPPETVAMGSSRCNPLVAAVPERRLVVVVGGARLVGGLVDIEEGPLPTEILLLDPFLRREQCAPLPLELGGGMSSALVAGRFLFVCGGSATTVSALDLQSPRAWTAPRELRPPQGQLASAFLASARGGHRLLLAGRLVLEDCSLFGVWDVDPRTLTVARKIGEMPPEMLGGGSSSGTLRCVGEDGLLYVISDDQHRAYPACACEVTADDCTWTKLPPLPVAGTTALSRFHKMLAFTSPVSL